MKKDFFFQKKSRGGSFKKDLEINTDIWWGQEQYQDKLTDGFTFDKVTSLLLALD